MNESPPVTTREAVLGSLLGHACIIIGVLLFPGIFAPGPPLVHHPAQDETRIPVSFQSPQAEQPSPSFGDAGKRNSSEPRPPDAPPQQNNDPYSVGNTRNRFVAPPMPEKTTPGMEPGRGPLPEGGAHAAQAEDRTEESLRQGEPSDESASDSDTGGVVPTTPGAGNTSRPKGKEGSLRDALGRMSMGMSGGGAPLKFDNPRGGVTGPMGGLSFETKDFDWGPYSRRIYWIIWNNWMRGWPPAAWAGLRGSVGVKFRIWKDGHISGIEVISASGTEAFDTCATLALEASNPLPALPDDFTKESEGITARFLYNTDAVDE